MTVKKIKRKKSPLKKIRLGLEAEFLILNKNGKPSNKADLLIEKMKSKKNSFGAGVKKECGKNEVEIASLPYHKVTDGSRSFLKDLKTLLYEADKEKLTLCPLGTFPGRFIPEMRIKGYETANRLFGRKFVRAARVFGYHCHYALPRGVFDKEKMNIRKMVDSKVQKTLIDSYNFLIAADPALITFMQSSPFYQGYHFAKDTRAIMYRRDENIISKKNIPFKLKLDSPPSKTLPPYLTTITDFTHFSEKLYQKRIELYKDNDIKHNYKSILTPNWTPVKINPHGTLEQRGMDMNHLLNIMSVSYLIKSILRAIQQDYYKVKISERGIKRPFSIEKRTIHIPPHSHVRKNLQKYSVLQGLEDKNVVRYCKGIINLSEFFIKKRKRVLLDPLKKIIKDKRTISDEIIIEAKKLGHKDLKKRLPQEIASQIAINHSKRLFKEIVLAQEFADEISK